MSRRSVHQKLYDAYQRNAGSRLSASDVDELFDDNAILQVVTNAALNEAGITGDAEGNGIKYDRAPETWNQFKKRLKGGHDE